MAAKGTFGDAYRYISTAYVAPYLGHEKCYLFTILIVYCMELDLGTFGAYFLWLLKRSVSCIL